MPGARDDKRRQGRPDGPLSEAELRLIGDRAFAGYRSIVLAVSGGADSMALMLLATRWLAGADAPTVVVATVDHGLRDGSAEEARWVGGEARALGLPHHILRWEGPKPRTGLQDAAREARYGLLEGLAGRLDLPRPVGIAVAHHLDDQAETLLMRLARGSGIDGLAAMQRRRPLGLSGFEIVRPLLDFPKSRLVATLQANGVGWREDPSNADRSFERIRVRQALTAAAALGLSADAVAASARRLGRAKAALDQMTDRLLADAIDVHGGAYATIDAAAFDDAPAELRLRLLQRVVARFGGDAGAPRLIRLETLAERLAAAGEMSATLGGCHLRRWKGTIVAVREPGRRGLPIVELPPGGSTIWDGRFRIEAVEGAPSGITVRAPRQEELAGFPALSAPRGKSKAAWPLPLRVMLTLPGFWRGGRLIGMPYIQVPAAGCSAEFMGL